MAKKYLSLEEAASLLGMSVDAVRRAREKGDLRGFQDRGSWKFREQDIDEFRRSQQADSSPDMPMLSADGAIDLASSDSDVRLMADPADDDLGDLVNSGSDVRLSGDSGPKLEKKTIAPDSDSDVKLFSADILGSDSDSDVKLSGEPGRTDSDIRLAPPDSDLKLIPKSSSTKAGDDSGISLEVAGSGARLNSGDDLLAEVDSGISLSADDSGISLESFDSKTSADDSGISLDAGDSGISLDLDLDAPSPAPADMSRTMPMQAIPGARKALADSGATTELEVPSQVVGRESEFELAGLDDDDTVGTSTSVLTFDDDLADSKTIAAGTIPAASADDEEVVEESYDDSESYEEESYDEYDAESSEGDEEGFEVGTTSVSGGPAVYARRADVDWGVAVKAMIGFSAILSVACAVVGVELIRTMWIWTQPDAAAPASAILDTIGSMF